jgi:hypothetical protein
MLCQSQWRYGFVRLDEYRVQAELREMRFYQVW